MPDFLTALRSELPNAVRTAAGGPVVEPESAEDTAHVLRLATQYGARLAPPGSEPRADRIPLDLRRMSSVVGYDEHAHLVHVEAGLSVAALADDLRRRGRALGLRRDAPAEPLGAFLARGAPGARSKDDDPVDQLVAGLTVVLADGRILELRPAPRRAAGPDLVSALVGARGALGVIPSAHLVTRARRPHRELTFLFPGRDGAEATRAMLRGAGIRPELAEIDDAPEGASLALRLGGEGALLDVSLARARSLAKARRGVEVSPREVRPPPPPAEPPPSPIVEELARALDPAGVLCGA